MDVLTELAKSVLFVIVIGVLLVVFGYAIVRSVSFAYFRTKLEHWRKVVREMKEGDR